MSDKTPSSVSKIRFSDCDMFGNVNNSRYLDYLLDAREDHLKHSHGFDAQKYYQNDLGWVVGNHEISYLKPAVYNEMVKIQSTLLLVENDHLVYESIMMNEQETHLKTIMRTKMIPINIKTGKRVEHQSDFMEWAKTLENLEINQALTLQARCAEILTEMKTRVGA